MYNPDDILILGDSFCWHRSTADHWPYLLNTYLTGQYVQPRGRGFPGASWWSVRKLLLTELEIKVPKVLVLCHTESTRLPNDQDIGINSNTVANPSMTKNMIDAASNFYKYLVSIEYMDWARTQWFKELDSIILDHNIERVVHLHCFPNYWNKPEFYTFNTGITSLEALYSICDDLSGKLIIPDNFNHFSIDNNHSIAKCLADKIINYKPGPAHLGLLTY